MEDRKIKDFPIISITPDLIFKSANTDNVSKITSLTLRTNQNAKIRVTST
jgi:hypothetical protein